MIKMPIDVIKLMAGKLDNPTLSSLSQVSRLYRRGTEKERIYRLFHMAREGGLDEVKLVLQKGTSIAWAQALLTTKMTMAWEDKPKKHRPVEIKQHTDTLLQLAWRMRDKEMFDLVKAASENLYPEHWKQQIRDFEGEQADCLDELAAAYEACIAAPDSDQLAINGIGGAQVRCWKNMAWVLHRMIAPEFDWDTKCTTKSYKRNVKNLKGLVFHQIRGAGLGNGWFAAPAAGIGGYTLLPLQSWRSQDDPFLTREWALTTRSMGCKVLARVIAKLKLKCVAESQDIQSQLSNKPSSESTPSQ